MEKLKPIAIISTDWHMKPDNYGMMERLLADELELADRLGVNTHIWLGDIFDSRISQKECVLTSFSNILDMYRDEGHRMVAIAGNHDKCDYNSANSFLHPYRHHPNFKLVEEPEYLHIGDMECLFIPFFAEEMWLSRFHRFDGKHFDILFSHMAMEGSVNNDGSVVHSRITPAVAKGVADKIYLGHYHNYSEIEEDVIHLGSICQNNFGEDGIKGFWVLMEDGSVELEKSSQISYRKLVVDIDELGAKGVEAQIEEFRKSGTADTRMRVEVVGGKDNIASLDKSKFGDVDIKARVRELEIKDADGMRNEIKTLGKADILERFSSFCSGKGLPEKDMNMARAILEEALENLK